MIGQVVGAGAVLALRQAERRAHGLLGAGPCATVLPAMRCPYIALDAFLLEHRLCRPGLDEPRREPDARRALVFLRGEDHGQAASVPARG
jgi:hypothetical protein